MRNTLYNVSCKVSAKSVKWLQKQFHLVWNRRYIFYYSNWILIQYCFSYRKGLQLVDETCIVSVCFSRRFVLIQTTCFPFLLMTIIVCWMALFVNPMRHFQICHTVFVSLWKWHYSAKSITDSNTNEIFVFNLFCALPSASSNKPFSIKYSLHFLPVSWFAAHCHACICLDLRSACVFPNGVLMGLGFFRWDILKESAFDWHVTAWHSKSLHSTHHIHTRTSTHSLTHAQFGRDSCISWKWNN